MYSFLLSQISTDENDQSSEGQAKIVMSDDIRGGDSFPDSDNLYFTKQHLKEALKDFRDKFHHETGQLDGQEISRSEAGKKKLM